MPYDNSGLGPLRVPGFSGLPINVCLSEESLRPDSRGTSFADGIDGWQGQRLTVREIAMLRLMESITDKPEWDRKVFDDAIVDKWRKEATALPLISEPAWKGSSKSNARCVKSDVLVSEDLRAELIAGVAPLLSVPEHQKDWHPGSNGQVLNLGEVAPANPQGTGSSDVVSARFQWLPAEVAFENAEGEDTDVRITSYINNLHPAKHQGLYRTVEKLIGISIPLWNDVVLYDSGVRTPLRIKTCGSEWTPAMPKWAEYEDLPTKVTNPAFHDVMRKIKEFLALPDRPGYASDDEEDDEEDDGEDDEKDSEQDGERDGEGDDNAHPEAIYATLERRLGRLAAKPDAHDWELKTMLWNAVTRKWKRTRIVAHPEPGQSFTYEEWKEGVQRPIIPGVGSSNRDVDPMHVSLQQRQWFRDQGLQVIVKLASIELTPSNPKYEGGNWHLEGMKNEHIVATVIYYISVDNTTSSRLSFRQGAFLDEMELRYEQDDHRPLSTVFGTNGMRDEPAVQVVGEISTPEGRILAFPNTLQHRVEPFELADKTKPGHRRFLVMWLVDPHIRICSTRNVPPQQHDWWAKKGLDVVDFRPLPPELVDMVKGEIGEWPMGLEEAKALRLELMAERTRMTQTVESNFEEYNLCEH